MATASIRASDNFEIRGEVVGASTAVSQSAQFRLRHTLGQTGPAGFSNSSGFVIQSGAVSVDGVRATERGIYNVLVHLGMVDKGMKRPPLQRRTRLLRALGHDAHVYAPAAGVFEPFHALGAAVEAGEPAGAVHFLDDPGREPVLAHFRSSGTIFSRRAPGQVVRGSCVAVVGADEETMG